MTWNGTLSTISAGKNFVILKATNFDADGDSTGSINIAKNFGFVPKHVTYQVTRTAGSQATISVQIQRSVDNITWGGMLPAMTTYSAAAVDMQVNYTSALGSPKVAAPYVRVLITTIGLGNTLDFWIVLTE